MKEKTIGILVSTEWEFGPLRDRLKAKPMEADPSFYEARLPGRRLILAVSGMGPAKAAEAARALLEKFSPEAFLCVGVCGSAVPDLKPMDVIVPNNIYNMDGGTLACDSNLTYDACDACNDLGYGPYVGDLLSVERPVRLPEEKQAIAQEKLIDALDMETFPACACAGEKQVPFAAVRCAFDACDETLEHPDGEGIGAAIRWAVTHPVKAAEYKHRLQEACRRLADVLERMLSRSHGGDFPSE